MSFSPRAAFAVTILFFVFGGIHSTGNAQTIPAPATPTASPTPNGTTAAPLDLASIKRVGIDSSQTLPISLDDAIRKALENNNSIEVARGDVKYAETQLRSLLGVYDTTFTVTPLFTRSSQNGSKPSNNLSLNLGGSKLFQSGGRIQPFFNNDRLASTFGSSNSFNSSSSLGSTTSSGNLQNTTATQGVFYNSNVGVSFVQPLFRNRSIDNTRRNIRIQRKRLQQTDADFRRTTIQVISQVQQAYWDLVFAMRDQQNRVANLNLSKENLRRVEAQIAAGAAAPLARAEVATELANRESDLLLAAQQVATADNALKQLLLKEPTAPEWTKQLVPTDQPNLDMTPINLEDALADARANRPELQRLNLQTEINSIDLDYFRNQTKPQIDLNSSFSLNGFSQAFPNLTASTAAAAPLVSTASDIYLLNAINSLRPTGTPEITNPTITSNATGVVTSGGFNNSLGNLFSSNAPSFSVGVTVGFPFRNRTAKADLAGARVQEQQIRAQNREQEQTIVVEVRNAVQAVETARQRIFAARSARENAEIQLRGEQKLYDVGRSTTFLLFQRENALANARNAEIRAETDYNKSISDLQRTTSTTFRANNIEVESPMTVK